MLANCCSRFQGRCSCEPNWMYWQIPIINFVDCFLQGNKKFYSQATTVANINAGSVSTARFWKSYGVVLCDKTTIEWPFIVGTQRQTCATNLMAPQDLHIPHLWGEWEALHFFLKIFESKRAFVSIRQVIAQEKWEEKKTKVMHLYFFSVTWKWWLCCSLSFSSSISFWPHTFPQTQSHPCRVWPIKAATVDFILHSISDPRSIAAEDPFPHCILWWT